MCFHRPSITTPSQAVCTATHRQAFTITAQQQLPQSLPAQPISSTHLACYVGLQGTCSPRQNLALRPLAHAVLQPTHTIWRFISILLLISGVLLLLGRATSTVSLVITCTFGINLYFIIWLYTCIITIQLLFHITLICLFIACITTYY